MGLFVGTHCDEAVRLDLVDPEALFHHTARLVQQLFELAQCEWSDLWDKKQPSGSAEGVGCSWKSIISDAFKNDL